MVWGDDALARAVVESSPDLVVVYDADGRARLVSDGVCELVGLPRERLIGHRISEVIDDSDYLSFARDTYEILDQMVDHVIATGEAHVDDDGSRITRSFEIQPALLSLLPIRKDGAVVGAVFTAKDRMQSGSLMFRRAAVGMAHVDRRGNVREANDALLTLVERDRAKVQGAPFGNLLHPDDVDRGLAVVGDVLHGRAGERQAELRLAADEGEVRWALVSASSNQLGGEGVGGACVVVQDITTRVRLQDDLEAARERLQAMALHDPLTGLPNRTFLSHHLGDAQRAAQRGGRHVGVLFLDLDGFKAVNDSIGHRGGDRILQAVADRITATLRPLDFAARLGGDEFVVCCPDLDADEGVAREEASRIAERLAAVLSEPLVSDDHRWRLGASIGVAVSRGEESPDDLLMVADAEMYRAKAARPLG